MTTALLDSNVLIALNVADHSLNEPARQWFSADTETFATCPITQGALVRHLVRAEWSAVAAQAVIERVAESPRHEFWPDEVRFTDVDLSMVRGHRQVTDAYLAGLARRRGARLATFDRGLAVLHPDVAELVPSP